MHNARHSMTVLSEPSRRLHRVHEWIHYKNYVLALFGLKAQFVSIQHYLLSLLTVSKIYGLGVVCGYTRTLHSFFLTVRHDVIVLSAKNLGLVTLVRGYVRDK